MITEEIIRSINQISEESEKFFLDLGNLFPSLLNRSNSSSIQELQNILEELKSGNNQSAQIENELFNGYGDKYNPLFEKLNEKIAELSELDKMIAGIKEDSEQMELIALNAMVISIKSGEKGQAFSRITENLQRLSNDMFLFSDKLIDEEKQLLNHINTLKGIFQNILNSQQALSAKGVTSSNSIIDMINVVKMPLTQMENSIEMIYPPIQAAMSNLQLQDIIRQALNHVKSCMENIEVNKTYDPASDEELDSVCFNLALYELAEKVLNDIISDIDQSFDTFHSKWKTVTNELSDIDSQKNQFVNRFLNPKNDSSENISSRLDSVISHFGGIMDEFGQYHIVQKDLLHTCQSISEKARTMFAVFGNLRPVMSRLHHVRILQQIEVAKNEAIKSVKDSVTDMDNLISSANQSLDTMETLLQTFISDTSHLLSTFTTSIDADNKNMVSLRKSKTIFFDNLKLSRNELESVISNFAVFPMGFEEKCNQVQNDLRGIKILGESLDEYKSKLHSEQESLIAQRDRILMQKGLSSWQIKNSKFSEIINHFTITAHKEAAGKIGGFNIEKGSSSGEITFF